MKNRKEKSTGKSIVILFVYLVVWWICLTLFSYVVGIDDSHKLFHLVNILRLSVPILVVIVGAPCILIIGYNKEHNKEKKLKK